MAEVATEEEGKQMTRPSRAKSMIGFVPITYIALWAAIMAAAQIIPVVVMVGGTFTFTADNLLMSSTGMLFGPLGGFVAAAIGGIIGQSLAPWSALLGPIQFLAASIPAAIVGLAMVKKEWASMIIVIVFSAIFAVHPNSGLPLWYYHATVWGIGFIMLLPPINRFALRQLQSGKTTRLPIAIIIYSIMAVMINQVVYTSTTIWMFNPPTAAWHGWYAAVLIQRSILIIGSVLLGTAVTGAIQRSRLRSRFRLLYPPERA